MVSVVRLPCRTTAIWLAPLYSSVPAPPTYVPQNAHAAGEHIAQRSADLNMTLPLAVEHGAYHHPRRMRGKTPLLVQKRL